MPIDVVYPLGSGSKWGNNELRYSLRALEKNFLDLGRVFICGVKPPWLTGVIHIPVQDRRINKDANLIDKVLAACRAGMSETFVRSSDDEVLLVPCHAQDLLPYQGGDLSNRGEAFFSQNPWHERIRATVRLLKSQGRPTIFYDTHIPTLCHRSTFEHIAQLYPYTEDIGYTINTWYLNHENINDPPSIAGKKLTLERPGGTVEQILAKVKGKKYLGYNDGGLTADLKRALHEMFPEPSRFESDAATFNANRTYTDTVIIPTVVAVLGSPRCGSSCTAGILHHLGVSMGERLRPPAPRNPKGFFEAVGLRQICGADVNKRERQRMLRRWAVKRGTGQPIIGGKDARLCGMIPMMVKAWPGMKAIAVDRPIEEIVASMQKSASFRKFSQERCRKRALRRINARDRELDKQKVPTLRLPFAETVADPETAVLKIIEFLGINPTKEQIEAAVAFVDPTLKHHNVTQ